MNGELEPTEPDAVLAMKWEEIELRKLREVDAISISALEFHPKRERDAKFQYAWYRLKSDATAETAAAAAVVRHNPPREQTAPLYIYSAMVFMVLTRSGFDAVFPRLIKDRDALWVNVGVLSDAEVGEMRDADWNLTTWRYPLTDLTAEIDMVRDHHPEQIIWAETAAGEI
jgi:hypothetical protein